MRTKEASRYMSQAGNLDRAIGGQSDTQSGTERVYIRKWISYYNES
jgi:hypothetical protein